MIIANSMIGLLAFLKLFMFFRAVPVMAKMFTLIKEVVVDLVHFAILFAMVVCQSTLMYSMSGALIYSKDEDFGNQSKMPHWAMQLINAFRMSVGDINIPTFEEE